MFFPFRSNGANSEEAMPVEAGFRKQFFGPLAQRSSEPTINGNTEAHLGALQKVRRNILVENLTENPLTGSIANLEAQGQLPGELDNAMVQQWNARLKAHGHAGTVHFGENVVRQIIEQIGEHHELFEGGNPRWRGNRLENGVGFVGVQNHARRIFPMRESTQINRLPALHRQIGCKLMNLVSRSRQSHPVGHYWTEHLKCAVNGARGDRLQQLRGGFSRSPWQPFDSIPNGTCKKIAVVAAE